MELPKFEFEDEINPPNICKEQTRKKSKLLSKFEKLMQTPFNLKH